MLNARYASPETAGSIQRNPAVGADLYSTGAALFFMLTGKPPYLDKELSGLLLSHMAAPIPLLSDYHPDLPSAFQKIIDRLLAKDPGSRYQTAQAVLYDLEVIESHLKEGKENDSFVAGQHDVRHELIEPRFVARHAELQSLVNGMKKCRAGKGGLVFLEGESGRWEISFVGGSLRRGIGGRL